MGIQLSFVLFNLAGTYYFLRWYLRDQTLPQVRFVLLIFILLVISIVGTKLLSLAERSWFSLPLNYELTGGWRQPGGILLLALLAPLTIRLLMPTISWARFLDGYLIFHAFYLGMYRIRCHLNGCCVGGHCHGPHCIEYGVHTPAYFYQMQQGMLTGVEESVKVFPLHLLYMFLGVGLSLFLLWFSRRSSYDGQVALLFFAVHEFGKGFLDTFREPSVSILQSVSFTTASVALLILLVMTARANIQAVNKR